MMLVTISILFVMFAVPVDGLNPWEFPKGMQWLLYLLNATIFFTGCIGNASVIYVLGIGKKGKVFICT